MNSNADTQALCRDIAAISNALDSMPRDVANGGMLVMRLVHALSSSQWLELREQQSLGQWLALPAAEAATHLRLADIARENLREQGGATVVNLGKKLFTLQLDREILRLNRNGGALSLLCVCLAQVKKGQAEMLGQIPAADADKLQNALAASLADCDSLGGLEDGCFLLLLPGMGQLQSRNAAESIQKAFADGAKGRKTGQKKAGIRCAVGIVSLNHGEAGITSEGLLGKVRLALEQALLDPDALIHQDCPSSLDERATLVHSNEKRFLFFGGA